MVESAIVRLVWISRSKVRVTRPWKGRSSMAMLALNLGLENGVRSVCPFIFARGQVYFGIGIDTAFPAPRSAIQIVSPAGSTPVGVLSPSLSTVTLALSPCTVRAEILPFAFSATRSFPFAARMPSGPFIG